ncbi:MAG: rhodanese-like domain-containing protein [Marinicellaceae bacterium]
MSFNSYSAITNLSSQQLIEAKKNGTVIIDIRTPEEWQATGTIAEASTIMFFNQQRQPLVEEFMSQFKKVVLSKDQKFVLVCRSGTRTKAVANYLYNELGYTNVSHLAKGMNQWILDSQPVVSNK